MNHKVLLIDESAMLRRITANILRAQPERYDVVAATRAVEGFARACAGDVDLILLDYQIAGFADAELCQRFWTDPRTSRLPTILMIGQGLPQPSLASLPPNVVEVLNKPVAPEQLSGVVNAVFGFTRVNLSLKEMRAKLHPNPTGREVLNEHRAPRPGSFMTENAVGQSLVSKARMTGNLVAETATDYRNQGRVIVKGDTKTVSLSNVVRFIEDRQLSGVLSFQNGNRQSTDMIFDGGRLLVLSTKDADIYATCAAEILPEKVSQATLDEAVEQQRVNGTPFLLTLGTSGLLPKSAAISLLDRFGQRHFARLWSQRDRPMHYEFSLLDALPSYALRLGPAWDSADEWLLKAARQLRLDDVAASLRHEGSVGTPFHHIDSESILKKLSLNDEEQKLLELVAARHALPKIAEAMQINPEAAYLMLCRFRCLDVLNYRPAPAAFVMTPRTHSHRILPLNR